ncbi:mandelate racemase/muconate lactonizing enzyme family protein [Levilactobacillus angrenensis]|uniref:Mandelate racemase/muconate lactonizing enzyme family protein n=1 Tax=Levilactobacillus angrenensis TaxID=2486020 RepID=A0ABW1U6R9_9LACO|nr:mandelate racemase/muconate lactonizing enzyme family protein [Levilactobacillus angrenensis]
MKITSVDIFQVKWNQQYGAWHPIVIRVNTDDGISGFGESGIFYGDGEYGALGSLKDLSRLIIGQDPQNIEKIWQQFYQRTFWGKGSGTTFYAAVSAIDTALWDIKGKSLGVPVYQLLGGQTREKIPAYASQLQFGWHLETKYLSQPDEYAKVAQKAVDEGYQTLKIDPFMLNEQGHFGQKLIGLQDYAELALPVARLKAIREAVGPKINLIVECHAGLDVNSAKQFLPLIEPLNIFYLEEPCSPLSPKLTKQLKAVTSMPLASGERITTRYGFQPFITNRLLDVIQPDVAICGGISEAKKICDMASAFDIGVQLHTCGTPIATAMALQVEATVPNCFIHEQHEIALKPDNQWIGKYSEQPDHGKFTFSKRPGIGQELSDEAIQASHCETIQ